MRISFSRKFHFQLQFAMVTLNLQNFWSNFLRNCTWQVEQIHDLIIATWSNGKIVHGTLFSFDFHKDVRHWRTEDQPIIHISNLWSSREKLCMLINLRDIATHFFQLLLYEHFELKNAIAFLINVIFYYWHLQQLLLIHFF